MQIHWFWIRVQIFGKIWIQDYVVNTKNLNSFFLLNKIFLYKSLKGTFQRDFRYTDQDPQSCWIGTYGFKLDPDSGSTPLLHDHFSDLKKGVKTIFEGDGLYFSWPTWWRSRRRWSRGLTPMWRTPCSTSSWATTRFSSKSLNRQSHKKLVHLSQWRAGGGGG